MFSFEGKVVLVTGASRGIGKAIASQFKDSGAIVIGTATSATGADKISEYLGANNGQVLNVTNDESIATLFEHIKAEHGGIDILVNNAGITRDTTFKRMDPSQWLEVINTNLNSMFNVTRLVINKMLEQEFGRVINISSINAEKGQFGQTNYSAAKAGIHGFTKALAQEVASKGITINTVSPGYIATSMIMEVPEPVRDKICAGIPVGRFGEPKEIARIVSFLADAQSGFITGSNISANGGQHMH